MAREVGATLGQWRRSPDEQAFRITIKGKDREGLRGEFDALLSSPLFDRTRQLIRGALGSSPFPIKSISLGVAAQVELGLGLYGSVGIVADIADPAAETAVYILAGAVEGLDEGGDVAIQAGLWRQSPKEIGGFYYGVGLTVVDVVGVGVSGLRTNRSSAVVSALLINFAAGVDDGVNGMELYALTFDGRRAPGTATPGGGPDDRPKPRP